VFIFGSIRIIKNENIITRVPLYIKEEKKESRQENKETN
jgi:hypothetical protein